MRENMWSKAEEKTMFARNRTCCTNSTEGATHGSIWKNKQSPTVFLHDGRNFKYWLVVRHNARCRSTTTNKLTFFQKVLVFSDGKQPLDLIVSFGILLFLFDTTSSYTHGQHSQSTKVTCI